MFTYLTMTAGGRQGRTFVLEPGLKNLVGRGPECQVVLSDPLCSRVHAVLEERDGQWHVVDQSTNGTLVNGDEFEEAILADGHVLRIGSTELAFHQTEESPTLAAPADLGLTQTLVRDTPVGEHDSAQMALAALQESPEAQDLLQVHQLSLRLLHPRTPEEILRETLELVRERTEASSVAFLWADDGGPLRTKMVVPAEAARRPLLSESMSQMVTGAGRALWIANQSGTKQHDADALYVPLVHESRVLGALQVYLSDGHFRQSQFDFAISAANIASRALAHAGADARRLGELRQLQAALALGDELIGDSPAIAEIKSRISEATSRSCVLLRGERGAGKRFLARLLHRQGPRADGPLVMLSGGGDECAAPLDERQTWLPADMGTVYLDDVSRLNPPEQELLGHLIDGTPVVFADALGQQTQLDLRFILATSVDLRRRVQKEDFSSELHQRISQCELELPPLRERREDVSRLIGDFFDHFRAHHNRPELSLSDAAREKLDAHDWPGNVRELRNVLDTAVTVAEESIEPGDLMFAAAGPSEPSESLRIDHWERKLIVAALKRAGGSVPEAAKLLGIGRATLYRKIEEYGIER